MPHGHGKSGWHRPQRFEDAPNRRPSSLNSPFQPSNSRSSSLDLTPKLCSSDTLALDSDLKLRNSSSSLS